MARKNPLVKIGRPRGLPSMPKTPTEALAPAVPAAAFKSGGGVGGYKTMPSHHDCATMNNLKRKEC